MKKTVFWADRIIAVSSSIVPELVEFWGIDESKIDVIHNGISDEWLHTISAAEKERVLKKFNLKPGFLLFVGTLQPKKNIDRIIQAYKQLDPELRHQHKLVIVGRNGWQTDELMSEINQLIADDEGVWLQYVSIEDLRVLYQGAQLFLFPSLHEGFGIPILEAFASKVPVITSNITAMPEVAGDAAFLVDPYQVADITAAVEKLLTDSKLCAEYIIKGSERIKNFSWQRCAEKTLEVYQKLL